MDADDLDYRARTQTECIPPDLVSRLVELGHLDEVIHQAARGEWFCAQQWAQLLGGQHRQAQALEVLAPYVATGWWTATKTMADLLESWGRIDEAITVTRPFADAGDCSALDYFARLLGRNGRGDEAFALLAPQVGDWVLAGALVAVSAGAGRDDEVAALLTARMEKIERRCDSPSCRCGGPDPSIVGLLAEIRERQGRIDEAIALLVSINSSDGLADLLIRHDRIEELRKYAASDQQGYAVRKLAALLEQRGDVDGAISAYRRHGDEEVRLAELLARHGRGDEALEVMRAVVDSGGVDDWLVHALCGHYTALGRAEDGLAHLDAIRERRGGEPWEIFWMRLPLLAACGRVDLAIELTKAHPEGDSWYAARSIAEVLADAGRTEEAITVLEPHRAADRTRASLLIELGRIEEAIALIQQRQPRPAPVPSTAEPAF